MANEVINGSDVHIFFSLDTGTTAWVHAGSATSHSLSVKMATRDTSNKGSGTWVTKAPGRLDVSGSAEGMCIDNDKYNYEDFMIAITTRVPLMMIFSKEASAGVPDTTTSGGAHYYSSGLFYLTSCDATFPDQGNATYSITFEHAEGFEINHLYVS